MATMPVTRVVVLEDRAQVEREGTIALTGVTTVEFDGLPLVAVDRSLKVDARGGTVLDAKLVRRWKEQPPGGLPDDASALRLRVRALEGERAALADEAERLMARARGLATARADLLRAIAEWTGHGTPDIAAWQAQLEAVSTKQAQLDEQLLRARRALQRCEAHLTEAGNALRTSEAPARRLSCALVLTLEGQGEAQVRARYLVPCAVWRPAYRATLQGDSMRVEAEAVVWQHTGEDWADVHLQLSTARPTLGTTPPSLVEDVLTTRPRAQVEKQVVQVALREEEIQSAGEAGGEAELPGLDDGGEVRILSASAPTTIRSDGQPHRVALFSFEARAAVERVCPAELGSHVYLVGRFPNQSGQVLLAGPVDLVRDAGLVGRSQLAFAAPGEVVKLSFGVEDGVQVLRTCDETQDEARLTGRRTTTTRVHLHVSNQRPHPLRLVLEERVPVSEVKEVEVQVLTKACQPPPSAVTQDGIARLEFEVAPGARKAATFAWELSAAAKVSGV